MKDLEIDSGNNERSCLPPVECNCGVGKGHAESRHLEGCPIRTKWLASIQHDSERRDG